MDIDVNEVFITKEVAERLDINPSYLIRVAKQMLNDEELTPKDLRMAGKRNYIFNENAFKKLQKRLQNNDKK